VLSLCVTRWWHLKSHTILNVVSVMEDGIDVGVGCKEALWCSRLQWYGVVAGQWKETEHRLCAMVSGWGWMVHGHIYCWRGAVTVIGYGRTSKYSVWSSFQVRVWTVWIMCSRQSVMTLLVSYQARVELLVGLGCFYPVAGTVGSWRGVIRRANLLAPLYPHQWMVGLQWWSNWRWGYHCPQRPSWWVRSCFFSYISPCISKYWNNFVLGGWVLNDQKIAFWLSRFLF